MDVVVAVAVVAVVVVVTVITVDNVSATPSTAFARISKPSLFVEFSRKSIRDLSSNFFAGSSSLTSNFCISRTSASFFEDWNSWFPLTSKFCGHSAFGLPGKYEILNEG